MKSQSISIIIDQIFVRLRPSYKKCSKKVFYTEIADRLSLVASKSPPWTWRYIQGIHSGTLGAGHRVDQAARLLLDRLAGVPTPVYLQSESVHVRVRSGSVLPGAWVLGSSRSCANPSCDVRFVPCVPWQKYCPLHNHH